MSGTTQVGPVLRERRGQDMMLLHTICVSIPHIDCFRGYELDRTMRLGHKISCNPVCSCPPLVSYDTAASNWIPAATTTIFNLKIIYINQQRLIAIYVKKGDPRVKTWRTFEVPFSLISSALSPRFIGSSTLTCSHSILMSLSAVLKAVCSQSEGCQNAFQQAVLSLACLGRLISSAQQ